MQTCKVWWRLVQQCGFVYQTNTHSTLYIIRLEELLKVMKFSLNLDSIVFILFARLSFTWEEFRQKVFFKVSL